MTHTPATREEGDEPACATCWFEQDRRCHRYPPQRITQAMIYGITIGASARFPKVNEQADSWCGEYRPSDKEPNR